MPEAADPVAERLAGMLERHDLTLEETGSAETYVCRLLASAADIPAAVAAVEAALVLHVPDVAGFDSGNWCACCTFNWPCSTYRAISAALLGEG